MGIPFSAKGLVLNSAIAVLASSFFGLSKLGVATGMNIGHLAVIDSNKTLCPTTNIFKWIE
jgi:hypothetical protein